MAQIIEVPNYGPVEFPDDMSDVDISAAIRKSAMGSKANASTPERGMVGNVVESISEPLASMATGTVGAITGGLAGLVGAALPGPPGQGADVAQRVGSAMTYEPRSTGGKAVLGAVSAPFEWLAGKADQIGGATADATGSPLAGSLVNAGFQGLPMAAGRLAPKVGIGSPEAAASVARRTTDRSLNSVKDTTLAEGRAAGLVVPPSAIEGSFVTNRAEGVAGKAALNQEANLRNRSSFNRIARQEASIAPDAPISLRTLEEARTKLAEPYREFEALPALPPARTKSNINPMRNPYPLIGKNPATPAELVHQWKSNNSTITELWKDYQRNARVETLDSYRAARETQVRIELDMEKSAIAAGRPDLVPALRDARVKLAKNYDVERSLNVGSGDVDAGVLGRMFDASPAKYSGGLVTIGKFANAFKPWSKDAAVVPAPGVSKLEAGAAILAGVGGHAALGPFGGLLATAPIVAPPMMRSLLLSKVMQQPRNYSQGKLSSLLSQPQIPLAAGVGAEGVLADIDRRN